MRRLVEIILSGAALSASIGFAAPADDQIARLEARVKERPRDFMAATMLGAARAEQARESGNLDFYRQAVTAFDAALGEFPEYAGALAGLASVRLALHRFDEARELALKILHNDPSNTEAHLLLSDAQLALGDDEAAAKIIATLADSPPVFARRAELARLHGDNEQAQRLFIRAADEAQARGDSPENIASYRVRAGEMHFRTGNFTAAAEQYRLAVDQAPQSYLVREHVAELRGAQEEFPEAVAIYEKLVTQSHRPDIEQALGDLYLFMHQPALANSWRDKALAGYLASVERGETHFIHHLAGLYADSFENGPEAVKWARKDFAMRQTSATHDALAWALYRAGDFKASKSEIDAALAGGIRDAHIFTHAGMIYSAAGNLGRGQELLHEAAALNPHYNNFHVHR